MCIIRTCVPYSTSIEGVLLIKTREQYRNFFHLVRSCEIYEGVLISRAKDARNTPSRTRHEPSEVKVGFVGDPTFATACSIERIETEIAKYGKRLSLLEGYAELILSRIESERMVEVMVLRYIAGWNDQRIASKLLIDRRTVARNVNAAFKRLETSGSIEVPDDLLSPVLSTS